MSSFIKEGRGRKVEGGKDRRKDRREQRENRANKDVKYHAKGVREKLTVKR